MAKGPQTAAGHKRAVSNLKPFVKGDPRINRKGQPKKILKLQKLLEHTLGIPEGGNIDKSDIVAIIRAVAREAKKGDVIAAREILDRLYGKVKQVIDVEGNASTPVQVPAINVYNVAPPLAGSEDAVKLDNSVQDKGADT